MIVNALGAVGAAFVVCTLAAGLYYAATSLARSWRKASRVIAEEQARPPAPGPGVPRRPPTAPAPGPHHQLAFTLRMWRCGRMRTWDGHGRLFAERGCACHPVDWERHEREL